MHFNCYLFINVLEMYFGVYFAIYFCPSPASAPAAETDQTRDEYGFRREIASVVVAEEKLYFSLKFYAP